MRRRKFLKRGLFGGALLALAGTGIAVFPGDRSVRATGPLLSFSPAAFSVLAAVAARVVKGTSADPMEIAMRIDAALQRAAPEARVDLGRALLLLENGLPGLLFRGTPRPFTLLAVDDQDRALLAWRDSRLVLLRGAYHGLRKLCLAAHYATPAGWPETGYGGPLIPKPEPPAISARAPLVVTETADVLPPDSKGT